MHFWSFKSLRTAGNKDRVNARADVEFDSGNIKMQSWNTEEVRSYFIIAGLDNNYSWWAISYKDLTQNCLVKYYCFKIKLN
jgi:hypothetical protein